jgi:hypothetical protein
LPCFPARSCCASEHGVHVSGDSERAGI